MKRCAVAHAQGRAHWALVESRGVIEFRYADGRRVSGEYGEYTSSKLNKGDRLVFDGAEWVMRDREDRGGVTVYLFSPADASDGATASVTFAVIDDARVRLR